ncbi:hypothetical protein [Enterococcus gallinarum]|uniref:hypothetical protein n=1 Tax=Enterococcus gallinarum TaxID=1353 RepID=UPI0018AAD4BD|nr:hypothetical protein [Enterococcus gallinarum]
MGTSKGYIAPTRIEWSQAKRAVSQMLRDGDSSSLKKAASKFSTAMKSDAAYGKTFSNAATGILSLSKNISSYGLNYALEQINRSDLIGKPSEEIWNELLNQYTSDGATVEDSLAADALSKALENLQVNDLDQLGNVPQENLLKEMLIEFIAISFDFRFAEKIGKGRLPAETQRILKDMQDYIRSNLYEELNLETIRNADFSDLSNNKYVSTALTEAFSIFEELFTEE